jgi:hypothetical protein
MGRNRQKAIFEVRHFANADPVPFRSVSLRWFGALLSLTLFPGCFYGYPYEMVIHGFPVLLRIRKFVSPTLLLRP